MKSLSPPLPNCFVQLSILTSGLGTLIFPSLTEDSLTSYFVEKVEDSTYIFLTSYYFPPSVTNISGSMFQILPPTARTTLPPGIPNLSPSQEHTPPPKGVFVFWSSAPVQTHSPWLPTNIYMCLPYYKHKQKQGNPLTKQYKPHLPPIQYCPLSLILLVWTLLKEVSTLCYIFTVYSLFNQPAHCILREYHAVGPYMERGPRHFLTTRQFIISPSSFPKPLVPFMHRRRFEGLVSKFGKGPHWLRVKSNTSEALRNPIATKWDQFNLT